MFRRLLFLLWLTVCLSSAHAQTWYWSSPMPHGNSIIALNYYAAGGLGIEACDSGQIYTSPDFTNWIAQASCTTNSLQAIAFLNNRIILTGQSGTVVYSDDGYNYNYTNLNTNAWLVGVAASTNLAVAVGDDAVIYTSTDGANWTLGSPPPGIGNNWLLAAAYGAGTFIIAGEGGYLATSTNGTTWKQRTISTGFSANINDVQWIRLTNPADGFPTNSFVVFVRQRQSLLQHHPGHQLDGLRSPLRQHQFALFGGGFGVEPRLSSRQHGLFGDQQQWFEPPWRGPKPIQTK